MLMNNDVTLLWKLLNLSFLSQHSGLDVQKNIYIIYYIYIILDTLDILDI